MKTPEDEAFDELARRQGAWGGGFKAKQAMAADKQKEYDPCLECIKGTVCRTPKCGRLKLPVDHPFRNAQPAQEPVREVLKLALEALEESKTNNDSMEFHERKNKAIAAIQEALTQPAQEPTGMLHITRLDKWLDASLQERKQREWVGLTDPDFCHQINTRDFLAGAFFAEAKLKDKNT